MGRTGGQYQSNGIPVLAEMLMMLTSGMEFRYLLPRLFLAKYIEIKRACGDNMTYYSFYKQDDKGMVDVMQF